MTLRDQLSELLPGLLPENPDSAVNGTSLLEAVRPRLQGEYTEATIRQHFSVMAGDPTSPIARVSQGHGYYLRAATPVVEAQDAVLTEVGVVEQPAEQDGGRSSQREEKFRALFIRYCEIGNRFPVHIEHTTAARQPAGVNKWKFPDVVVLDWDVGRISDAGYQIDRGLLEVKRSLGDQPFRLTSVELKVGLSLSSFRESFFQCVSNSKWAHHAYLVTANALQDETLVRELRRLGTSFDISVLSYGLSNEVLDQLPNAEVILRSNDQEIERLAAAISISRVSSGRAREALDWEHIEDVRTQSGDINDVFVWISRCLIDGRPYAFDDFKQIAQLEAGYR
ncbi:hypothetical protein ZRA01_08740 [Zoogloea ramigera]|uniref:Uncharacterized protein n=1 Tax=Zoogloea ramigera TaxID=350 RepID=A0A4Y4CPC6_ZOORA|nr:hypothetical protein [Zoogloea ramigera]GEC94801.1 hypothetical protein ZRA01_08740 [Zoogloea ramigera]